MVLFLFSYVSDMSKTEGQDTGNRYVDIYIYIYKYLYMYVKKESYVALHYMYNVGNWERGKIY